MGAAFAIRHCEGNALGACTAKAVAYIGIGRESDGLCIPVAEIPYPIVDKSCWRCTLVGKSHGLPLAVIGGRAEMRYRGRVYGHRTGECAFATGCIGNG